MDMFIYTSVLKDFALILNRKSQADLLIFFIGIQ